MKINFQSASEVNFFAVGEEIKEDKLR